MGFLHELAILRDDAEAPALGDVEPGEVEAVHVEDALVDDHHLAVIADEIVGAAGHGHAGGQQPQFQLPQDLVAAAVSVRDDGAHVDPTLHRPFEGVRNLVPIVPEDEHVDGLFRLFDGSNNGPDASVGLNDEFHTSVPA